MADFGNIQTPDFTRAALGGYAAGRAVGQQRQRDTALQAYQTDPEQGIEALTTVDPALAEQLRTNMEAKRIKAAYAKVYAAPALGGQSGALGAPATSEVMPAPAAQPAPMMAGGLPIDMGALQELASIGPDGAKGAQAIYQLAKSGDEARINAFKAHAEVKGQLALYLKSLPPEQRAAAYQAAMPELLQRGFVAQASEGMRFDDNSLDRDVALAVPTVQALTQARADRTEARAERRAQTAEEISRAGLGIRREALEVARNRAAGGGAPATNFGALDDAALLAIIAGQN